MFNEDNVFLKNAQITQLGDQDGDGRLFCLPFSNSYSVNVVDNYHQKVLIKI